MRPRVLSLRDLAPELSSLFGPKAASLAELARAGFPVPPGFAVSTLAYRDHVLAALGQRQRNPAQECLAEARRLLASAPLASDLVSELDLALRALGLEGVPLAVRSSSTNEDLVGHSGAGVQDSVLGVTGPAALADAVRAVWASAWTERARAYGARSRDEGSEVLVGVVVQRLVPAEAAGVLFTANPVTGGRDEVLVNSAFGLGEPILSGRVTPDTFVVDKRTLAVTGRAIAEKRVRVVCRHGGLESEVLPEALRVAPSLSEERLQAVAGLGLRVERHFGEPRDVEWACEGESVLLLQARPITALPVAAPAGLAGVAGADPGDVWTNANVGEALPGVATPLTWSVAARYSERGFRRAFAALACAAPRGAPLVACFRGRIYLNLTQMLRVLSQVPLLSGRAIADLGGSVAPDSLELAAGGAELRLSGGFFLRLPGALYRLAHEHVTLEREVNRLELRVVEAARALWRADLTARSGSGLREELRRIDELLDATGDAMLTCAATSMATFLLLRAMLRRWLPHEVDGLERELVAGAADLESAKPGIALWHLAEAVRAEPASARLLLERKPSELAVRSFPEGSKAHRGLEAFLAAHGYRGVREAELMTPRWSEDPTLVFATIREHLRSGGPPPERAFEQRIAARQQARDRVDRALDPARRAAVRHAVVAARRYARLRERLRAKVTQVLGMYRVVALEVGRRIGEADAAFFLSIDEVHAFLASDLAGLQATLAARRRQHEADLAMPDPPATFVGRPPEVTAASVPEARDRLAGLGACPGSVTGEARVLDAPSEAGALRAGEVLVVACADVGWTPLFLLASAVVTDRGGVLSHASVVAREFGVPMVVDLGDATRRIRTGDRLTVDGGTGTVQIHRRDR